MEISVTCSEFWKHHLNNYFKLHICLSFRPLVRPSHLQISLRLEVQRPSQTAAERGEAKLHILDF